MATPLHFPPFHLDEPSQGPRWTKYVEKLENFFIAMAIADGDRQKALLLHFVGDETYEIYDTMKEEGDDYEAVKEKLTNYFAPQRNSEVEKFKFGRLTQYPHESIDAYHTRLKAAVKHCDFPDQNSSIKSHIIQTCRSSKLRRKALSNPTWTLDDLVQAGRNLELNKECADTMESNTADSSVNTLRGRGGRSNSSSGSRPATTTCRNCNGPFPHEGGRDACPARGKTCDSCGKLNHFASCCLSTPVSDHRFQQPQNQRPHTARGRRFPRRGKTRRPPNRRPRLNAVDTSSSSDDEGYTFTVSQVNFTSSHPKARVQIKNTNINFMIDSGSSVNIIDEPSYHSMNPQPSLLKTRMKLRAYGAEQSLPIKGCFVSDAETPERITCSKFYVVKGNSGCLLSYNTSKELGLITCNTSVNSVNTTDSLIEEYSDLFNGIGKLKDHQVKLHIDPNVQPKAQPHRRIPFHMRKKVEAELKSLEQQGIIEKVEGPTPWVSPIVAVPKPKNPAQVRICVDMREPNQAIKRERHVTPTVDDIIHDLNGATTFSKLDLIKGYHQLEIHPDSRYITTFATHKGLRRYVRLNFGTSSAAECFQNAIAQVLNGIPGVRNFSDDIIVSGSTQEEHDLRLKEVFKRLRAKGLTLNKKKCEFNKQSVEFYGYIFSAQGMSACPKKVRSVAEAAPPEDASSLKSFLGMAQYCSRFIPEFSTISKPLWDLTKKDRKWCWTQKEQESFEKVKDLLTNSKTMAYFDPDKKTELIVDASPVGLAAVLTQKDLANPEKIYVIAYASRALTDVETRYSQTEREALAIVWGCEHFTLFLQGSKFTLVTDHRALQWILNNPRSKPNARIMRWGLRLMAFDYVVQYRKGRDNPADYMSRHPLPSSHVSKQSVEEYINFLVINDIPKAMTIEEIKHATKQDKTLQKAIEMLRNGKWHEIKEISENSEYNVKILKALRNVKDCLTSTDDGDVLLKAERIVLPSVLQTRALKIAHEGHLGIVKTKRLLREKVWFHEMDTQVEKMIENCLPCSAVTPEKNSNEPLLMSPLPEAPWVEVSADFYGPLPTGEYLLVVIDEYSRFPIVETLKSTSANAVIPILDKIFAMFGTCETFKTDNGPPWQSAKFAQFAEYCGFKHRKITPLAPKSNAISERFMQNLKKTLQTAKLNPHKGHWKQQLNQFLRNYRATKHSTTQENPAKCLFGREINIKLPTYQTSCQDNKIRQNDYHQKRKMKCYSDTRFKAKEKDISVGDTVLVKQQRENKLTSYYNPTPYTVIEKKGRMVVIKNNTHQLCRNTSQIKKIPHKQHEGSHDDESDYLEDNELVTPARNPMPARNNNMPERQYPARARRPPDYYGY